MNLLCFAVTFHLIGYVAIVLMIQFLVKNACRRRDEQ